LFAANPELEYYEPRFQDTFPQISMAYYVTDILTVILDLYLGYIAFDMMLKKKRPSMWRVFWALLIGPGGTILLSCAVCICLMIIMGLDPNGDLFNIDWIFYNQLFAFRICLLQVFNVKLTHVLDKKKKAALARKTTGVKKSKPMSGIYQRGNSGLGVSILVRILSQKSSADNLKKGDVPQSPRYKEDPLQLTHTVQVEDDASQGFADTVPAPRIESNESAYKGTSAGVTRNGSRKPTVDRFNEGLDEFSPTLKIQKGAISEEEEEFDQFAATQAIPNQSGSDSADDEDNQVAGNARTDPPYADKKEEKPTSTVLLSTGAGSSRPVQRDQGAATFDQYSATVMQPSFMGPSEESIGDRGTTHQEQESSNEML
jgi:hypothetical protein